MTQTEILQRTTTLLQQLSPTDQAAVLAYIETLIKRHQTQPTSRREKFLASVRTHHFSLPKDYQFDREACYER